MTESYIVRIHRRSPGELVGLIEHPETGKCESFHSADELAALLLDGKDPSADTERKRPPEL